MGTATKTSRNERGRAQAARAGAERRLEVAQERIPATAAAIASLERERVSGAGLLAGGRLERSSNLYGAMGAATVVLLWLYLTARFLVSAVFFNASLWQWRHPFVSEDASPAAAPAS